MAYYSYIWLLATSVNVRLDPGCTLALSVMHSITPAASAVCGLWRYTSVIPLPFLPNGSCLHRIQSGNQFARSSIVC